MSKYFSRSKWFAELDRENAKLFDNWEEIRYSRISYLRKRKKKRKLSNLKKRMKSRKKRKQYYKNNK
ncbi:MAG: hypothetical protein SLAVMIC_00338 [uncultured marine phage]|uniref:Uncharacterized protein n=1 Tax=uncultured marine phage TaxID=707152 RepID=A0A8D9C8R9_9VIRU|nr:MAG: hypothetical protein SLAVMIC_00338 [uncultured marine phage]